MNIKYVFLLTIFIFLVQVTNSKIIEKIFNVHYIRGSPDGVFKTKILSINDGQDTTIHWHGIHQKGTPFEDGTSQISQCPLKHGHTQIYEIPLHQAGTYWYHSHVESQYTEGLWGALIIKNSPEVYNYDDEIVITLNDWYHRSAKENEAWHLSIMSRGVPPYPDSGLINGRGRYNCTVAEWRNFNCSAEEQKRHIFLVTPGKKYRIRVINVSAYAMFTFSIDNHKLYAIEADGIDVARPVPADIAVIAAAQRYSFLVEMNAASPNNNQAGQDFLIRANMITERLMLIPNENMNPYPEAVLPNVTAVLKYATDNSSTFATEPHDFNSIIPNSPISNPIYLDENLLEPHDRIHSPSYYDEEFVLEVTFLEDEDVIRRGSFNASPFKLPSKKEKPLLMSLMLGEEIPGSTFPLHIRYGDVVQIVINNPFLGPHPFHLHGHSFWVLGTGQVGDGNYDPGRHDLILNGVKRDTVLVHQESWAVIRFVADNPGLWTFHCHIDWHNLSGMAATFIEAPELLRQNVTIPDEAIRICNLQDVKIQDN